MFEIIRNIGIELGAYGLIIGSLIMMLWVPALMIVAWYDNLKIKRDCKRRPRNRKYIRALLKIK